MNKLSTLIRSFSFGILTLLLWSFPNMAGAQSSLPGENLSLAKAIELTVNNHPLIKEAEDHISMAKAKIQEQQSSFYPQANVGLDYNYIGPLPYIQLPFNGGGEFYMATHNNYNGNFAINYLVYDFNRRKEVVKLLQSNETTEAEKINIIRNQLAYQTVNVYYAMLYIGKSIDVMDQQIQDLNEHLNVARKLVLTGSATGLDTLTTDVKLTALKNQKVNLENQLKKTEVVLKSLMNDTTHHTPLRLSEVFKKNNRRYMTVSLVKKSFLQREELTMNKLYSNTIHIQKTMIEKSNMPILGFHSSFGVKNGYPDNLKRLRGNYVLGLTAKIPIFDGYLRKAKLASADWNIQAVDDHAAVLQQRIRTEVEQALLDYNNDQIQLQTAEVEISQAEAAIKQARGLYESGSITNTTLLDTETFLSKARLKYTYQLYVLTISHYKLLQAVGEKIWK